jgi:hypothetical protein
LQITTAARLVFGTGGDAVPHQLQGWSKPEENHTWCMGPEATLALKLRPGEGDLLLEFTLRPFMLPPLLVRQRVAVLVNGTQVGEAVAQDESAVAFRVPRKLIGDATRLELTLRCPDAVSPADLRMNSDPRVLGFGVREIMAIWVPPEAPVYARSMPPLSPDPTDGLERLEPRVRAITGLSTTDLMLHFESLGHNCEFGLVQRSCGAEPLGLLRFMSVSPSNLLHGLDFGFEGADDPAMARVYANPQGEPEWMLRLDRYDMHAHTFRRPAEIDAETVRADEVKKLVFKRRRFLEVLESGQKLFVYQRFEHMTEAHALPVLNLLRSHGPNALLFVTADRSRPCGSVDRLATDLYRGNIDYLAPIGSADKMNLPAWVSICANAYRLWREAGLGGAP